MTQIISDDAYWTAVDRLAELCELPEEDITLEQWSEITSLSNLVHTTEQEMLLYPTKLNTQNHWSNEMWAYSMVCFTLALDSYIYYKDIFLDDFVVNFCIQKTMFG